MVLGREAQLAQSGDPAERALAEHAEAIRLAMYQFSRRWPGWLTREEAETVCMERVLVYEGLLPSLQPRSDADAGAMARWRAMTAGDDRERRGRKLSTPDKRLRGMVVKALRDDLYNAIKNDVRRSHTHPTMPIDKLLDFEDQVEIVRHF